MRQHKGESTIEFLRRVVSWLGYESENLLESLPTVGAILDYAALWDVYDTEFMSGIEEGILEGEDPKPLRDFVRKNKLDWDLSWIPRRRRKAA